MFGSLVIALPSKHTGGEVILKHGGRVHAYESAKHNSSYGYWYSNVQHEVRPVTSGYRVVLSYNLALNDAAQVPLAATVTPNPTIGNVLNNWRSGIDAGKISKDPIICTLEHTYAQALLSQFNLKGRDRDRVSATSVFQDTSKFDILLATFEKGVRGAVEEKLQAGKRYHDMVVDLDVEFRLSKVRALDGKDLGGPIQIMDNMLASEPWYHEWDTEERGYEGYQGNWVSFHPLANIVLCMARALTLDFLGAERLSFLSQSRHGSCPSRIIAPLLCQTTHSQMLYWQRYIILERVSRPGLHRDRIPSSAGYGIGPVLENRHALGPRNSKAVSRDIGRRGSQSANRLCS